MRNIMLLLGALLGGCGGAPAARCEFRSDVDRCNGIDDNCDGRVDEDCVITAEPSRTPAATAASCHEDDDCDDHTDCTDDHCSIEGCIHVDFCTEPSSAPCNVTTTSDCDNDGVTPGEGDCDDTDNSVSSATEESFAVGNTYDGKDNDCDHTADEWGIGPDRDQDRVPDNTDCDPDNPLRWTGAPEMCDDGVDANCDGGDNTDDWGNCTSVVGAIDGAARENTFERIAIAGPITRGLTTTIAPENILWIAIGSEANQWDATDDGWSESWRGDNVMHVIGDDNPFPRVAFVPRVRLMDGSVVDFDLGKWRLTGNLRKVPGETGRFTSVLIAP